MEKLYKLTDENSRTRNNTKWGEDITHETDGVGKLCGSGWLHAYLSPELASLLNPVHADFKNPILWEAEGVIGERDGQLKVGCTLLRTIRRVDLPIFTTEQRVVFAIRCAKSVYKDTGFTLWADAWLSGADRSAEGAWAAARAARAEAAAAAAEAAAWAAAARAAAEAAEAAEAAARAAAEAAEAAEARAEAAAGLDLVALARDVLTIS